MHRQVGALHVLEFGFDLLLGRVDDNRRALTKNEFLDFDESEQAAVANAAGVDFIDLSLAQEGNSIESVLAHGR